MRILMLFFLAFALALVPPVDLAPAGEAAQVSFSEADLVTELGIDVPPVATLPAVGARSYTSVVAANGSETHKPYEDFKSRGQITFPLLI